eukprot:3027054-Amphidinium_carterae.5
MSVARMNDVRVSARKALGKGANLRRSSPLELMSYGGPVGDPQVTADLNTIRVWQRKLNTGTLVWPLDESVWEPALNKGRGRGPIRHLKTLANRAGWFPHQQRWQCGEQVFTWQDADLKIMQHSSRALLADVTSKRPDFAGLETGLSNQALRHLKKCANKKDERISAALNAALGGVWHEEEPEDLSHILFRCPHWHKERREVELPTDDDATPHCVKLHGIVPEPRVPPVLTQEPGGVGYYTDIHERVWLPLPGLTQSVYRAEFLAVVRALE